MVPGAKSLNRHPLRRGLKPFVFALQTIFLSKQTSLAHFFVGRGFIPCRFFCARCENGAAACEMPPYGLGFVHRKILCKCFKRDGRM